MGSVHTQVALNCVEIFQDQFVEESKTCTAEKVPFFSQKNSVLHTYIITNPIATRCILFSSIDFLGFKFFKTFFLLFNSCDPKSGQRCAKAPECSRPAGWLKHSGSGLTGYWAGVLSVSCPFCPLFWAVRAETPYICMLAAWIRTHFYLIFSHDYIIHYIKLSISLLIRTSYTYNLS